MRYLISHADSDPTPFEVFDEMDLNTCLQNGADDVTGIETYETWFKTGKEPKMKNDEQEWLLIHEGGLRPFRTDNPKVYKQAMADGCEDVTHSPHHEEWDRTGKEPKKLQVRKQSTKPAEKAKPVPVETNQALPIKYRPKSLDDVVGQAEVVKSLKANLKSKTVGHAFLFTGPSGCGKTTIARILASKFGCSANNIVEVDAASNTGIDAVRALTGNLHYKAFGEEPNKMIIIDEAHGLSKAAWDALLITLEEPPPHVFFALCTTNDGKIPATVMTRCMSYNLKPVKFDDLMDLLEDVVKLEGGMNDLPSEYVSMVARACNGSPRAALTMLAKVADCETAKDVATLLEAPLEDKEIIDLCRALVKGELTWPKLTKTLKEVSDGMNAESIRIVITAYLSSCLMGAKSDKDAMKLLDIMATFHKPCNPTDKLAPLLLAFGNYIFPA